MNVTSVRCTYICLDIDLTYLVPLVSGCKELTWLVGFSCVTFYRFPPVAVRWICVRFLPIYKTRQWQEIKGSRCLYRRLDISICKQVIKKRLVYITLMLFQSHFTLALH